MERLRNVILIENHLTECSNLSVDQNTWRTCRTNNPFLRVHLFTDGKRSKEIALQEGAPVRSIVSDSTHAKVRKTKTILKS